MSKPNLKLVGQGDPATPTAVAGVPLKFGDLFPLLALAYRSRHAWMEDFADDPIVVTSDLAELLARYRSLLEEKSA